MGGTGVVDRFLAIFSQYIDSGFGLLSGEVAFIATTLIVIYVSSFPFSKRKLIHIIKILISFYWIFIFILIWHSLHKFGKSSLIKE